MPRICVFCGSQSGTNSVYQQAAEALGRLLVHHGYGLVYGGGHVGLMGSIADAVLQAGGEVIGVTTASLGSAFGLAQNLNLAVPVNILKRLLKDEYPARRKFGDATRSAHW